MANRLTTNPIEVDTASATPIYVKGVTVWVTGWSWNPTASGDDMIWKDGSGNEIENVKATGTWEHRDWGSPGVRFDGLAVTTLDTGKVKINLR